MSAEISKWRATYTPGNWVVLGGPSSLVVMQPAPARASHTINGFWDVIRTADSLDELMRLFAQSRLDQMPSFATFFWHKGEMRSIVRGKVQVVDAETGRALADGEGVQTWSEVGLADVKKVRIDMEPVDQDAVLQLPLATGVVLASAIYLDGTQQITSPQDPGAAAVSEAPAEESAAASKGQEAQEQEDHLTDADRQKLDQQMADLFGGAPKKDEPAASTSTPETSSASGAGAAGVAAAGVAGAAAGAMGAGAAGAAKPSDPFDFAGQQPAPQQSTSQPSASQQPASQQSMPQQSGMPGVGAQAPGQDAAGQQQGFGGSPFQRPGEPGGFGQQPGQDMAQPGQGMGQPAYPQSQPSPFAPPHSQASAQSQGSAAPAPAGPGQGFGNQQTEPHVVQAPFGQKGSPRIILRPTTGEPVEVDRTVLIGRSPTASRVAATDIPKLLTVPSPSHDISRTHLQVTVEGGVVRATDLNSTNGTALIRPETSTQELLPAGEPVEIRPGCVLSLGDGVELHVEQA